MDQQIIDRIAAALGDADIGHNMTLTRLVDGIHTYSLTIDGKIEEFVDDDADQAIDKVYARIREIRQLKQAEAVIAALAQAEAAAPPLIGPVTMSKVVRPAGLDGVRNLQAFLDAVEDVLTQSVIDRA